MNKPKGLEKKGGNRPYLTNHAYMHGDCTQTKTPTEEKQAEEQDEPDGKKEEDIN
jgi:hypothetical protein